MIVHGKDSYLPGELLFARRIRGEHRPEAPFGLSKAAAGGT